MKAYTNIEQFKNLDYSSLYGVKPDENDFSGAINRSIKEGPKHLDKNFVDAINDINTQRKRARL